jgi:putative antitoxin of VapBC-like toxin-antitoxin system
MIICIGYTLYSCRVRLDLNDELFQRAKKLTGLKSPEKILTRALELLVQSEARKGILRFYGSGIWQGSLKKSRRNRVLASRSVRK